ncbi:hypothetical protein BCR39DRAFT_236049 [Naematelia encephala]|uniref:Uncharacterized protein n=1 Tax=Naematelia encephala TaxID=71784 RepID=A0A1Y2BH22_9TREE|nr:hypothetical protein BCR39DRAFT_236049 [Naematelia encephala]
MSYYRPASGPAIPPAPPCSPALPEPSAPEPIPEEEEFTQESETAFSPSATSAPIVMITSQQPKRRRRPPPPTGQVLPKRLRRRPETDAEVKAFCAVYCNLKTSGRYGDCLELHRPDTVYCEIHACKIEYKDGTRCGNIVEYPTKSRVCTVGYHVENDRKDKFLHFMNKSVDRIMDKDAAADERHMADCRFFDEKFPGIATKVSDLNSSSSTSSGSRSGSSSGERRRPSHSEIVLGSEYAAWPVARWMSVRSKSPGGTPYRLHGV